MQLLLAHSPIKEGKIMRIKINQGKQTAGYSFGIYLYNWGYPIANEWEIGLYLYKWYIGVELFR